MSTNESEQPLSEILHSLLARVEPANSSHVTINREWLVDAWESAARLERHINRLENELKDQAKVDELKAIGRKRALLDRRVTPQTKEGEGA